MRGEVIGINSQIATSTGDYNGIGFALPTNIASSVFKQLMATGKVRRGYLGVFLDSVRPERRTANVQIGERPARNSTEGEAKPEAKPGKVENTQQDGGLKDKNDR